MAKRPLTMREMRAAKTASNEGGIMMLLNISKQLVHVHLKPPLVNGNKRADFYVGAQDVPLKPGQSYKFRKNRLWIEQVTRLCKQRCLQVISDTEKLVEDKEV
jgi:hypothetical protein